VLVTASYSLRALGKLFMGPLNPRWAYLPDLSAREVLAVAPLAVLMVAIGIVPRGLLDLMSATIAQMARRF
jgi:NADH-quinone oxidoreductase subunit M